VGEKKTGGGNQKEVVGSTGTSVEVVNWAVLLQPGKWSMTVKELHHFL
jgi:hypothetical protein